MRNKSLYSITGAVLWALLLIPQSASAFEYAGQAWCCDTVYYYVNETEPSSQCGGFFGLTFRARVNIAAGLWNNEGTAFILVDKGSTNIACQTSGNHCQGIKDGQNTVSMATGCSWSDNNIIAYATWWYWTGGDSAYCVYESDICFNDNVTWYNAGGGCTGNCYDLISVAAHELGHWIASNHENDNVILGYKPIMYYAFNYCEERRTVTPDDSALLRWAYDDKGMISYPQRSWTRHYHPPYPEPPPHDSCWPPPVYPPDCDSAEYENCLLVCPAGEEVWSVMVKNTRGDPICDMAGTWLDFTDRPVTPCPGEEPNWPIVRPDSCNPATGVHYFTVDAGLDTCEFSNPDLYIDGSYCRSITVRFFDNDGNLVVTGDDFVGGRECEDYNCNYASDNDDTLIWAAHLGHDCSGVCDCIPGDANNDGSVNVGDAVYVIAYIFSGGPPPAPYPLCSGDANCDCQLNVGDAVYIITYVFKSGPAPCSCGEWLIECGPSLRK